MMKKLYFSFIILILSLCFCALPAGAQNHVTEIDILVTVRDDGSAYVVQSWQGTFFEGTENYLPIATNGIRITDFSVSDKDGSYTYISPWNIDASMEEKAGKCGVLETVDGVELCFGISQYGENRYTLEYVIHDFLKSYTDYDGVNFMFVNPDMSTFPTDAKVRIVLQNGTLLTEENARIWAFGYDGMVEFDNGAVTAYTTCALTGNDSVILMLELDKGILSPASFVNESFETVKSNAFSGSDYDYEKPDSLAKKLLKALFVGLVLLLILFLLIHIIRRKMAIKKFYQAANYFRDVPNGKNMRITHYLAQTFDVAKEESNLLGALFLSMINEGCLEPQIEEDVGFFGKTKETVSLKLVKEPADSSALELYRMLCPAAGEDGILQAKELEKYSYRNPYQIPAFLSSVKSYGETEFISRGGFLKRKGNQIKYLSHIGQEELSETMGLQKYLKEFTLISEREIEELPIWKDYLVYATLYGIAEEVLKQLKKTYPAQTADIELYQRNVLVANSYHRRMYTSSQKAIQAQRSKGAGGRASFGGGGGFSGGGCGGGSR